MALFTAIGLGAGATILGGAVSVGGLALTAGAVATGAAINRADRAVSAQRSAAATQARMQQQTATRQRRSAIRSNLMRRQSMLSTARALGVAGSSAVGGGISSLSSQLGANLGFSTMMSGLGQQYSAFTDQAAKLQGQSDMFGTLGSFFFNMAPRFGPLQEAQPSTPTPQRNVQGIPIGPSGYPSL